MAASLKLSEADCSNVSWRLVEQTEDYRRYIGNGTHPDTGVPITVQKTEYLAEDLLLRRNEFERNEADGKRWTQGAGSDKNGVPLVKVASIPLNVLFAEGQNHMQDGDRDWLKWFLETDRAQPFRTRRGSL